MILLIPTSHELDQLPDLSTFLRPMDPQPREWTDRIIRSGSGWLAIDKRGYCLAALHLPPFAPDTEIAWREEWWKWDNGCRIVQCLERPVRTTWPRDYKRQPATTMPVELARYKSVVVECRPVELSKLTAEDIEKIGFDVVAKLPVMLSPKTTDNQLDGIANAIARGILKYHWQSNYPSFPFAKSWAWKIDLKGTQNG